MSATPSSVHHIQPGIENRISKSPAAISTIPMIRASLLPPEKQYLPMLSPPYAVFYAAGGDFCSSMSIALERFARV